jgi:hypothetical protein
MKLPSDSQARVLSEIEHHAAQDEEVFWKPVEGNGRELATLFYERLDRETNRGGLEYLFWGSDYKPIEATIRALAREGWVDDSHERVDVSGLPIIGVHYWGTEKPEPVFTRELTLTEDGVIALGLWRQRRARATPDTPSALSDREREVVELATRALELGYGLSAREPARKEARQLRKQGWFERRGAWIANSASALVPSASALCEVRPEKADGPVNQGAETA